MVFLQEDFLAVSDDAYAVIEDVRAAGVYVFGGGIDECLADGRVTADRSVVEGACPETLRIENGHTILERSSRRVAELRALYGAGSCQCGQAPPEVILDLRP
jgi:hypothetical protein